MHPGDGGNASIEVSSVNVTNELQGIKLSRNGNSKFARIEFYPDPTFGAGNGCGYGPFDSSVSIMAQTLPIDTPRGSSIHGFLGTFDALLYQSKADGTSCKISTAPRSFSPGMFSWFPLFFPLRHPIYVPPEAVLNVSFWRRSDSSMQKVWYEWCAEVVNTHGETISVSPIHNPNGRSSHVGL